eukprot:Rhum_TRINITY_DN10791_c0_g2::Rhum_TRINITY_DN10791_c0_g2_i1::g.39778::m.39778/K01885/EARS, gltX; glutamyl-tRNA synthetase
MSLQLNIHGKTTVNEASQLKASIAALEKRIASEKQRLAALEAEAGGAPAAAPVKEKGGKKGPAKENKSNDDKFTLHDAVQGKVCTRFPPEASGFMHIGHAKAALTNYLLAEKYGGRMVFRFDDTNPKKEDEAFEKSILEDTARLGVKFEKITYTSDRFEEMITLVEQMLTEGKAYVDDTDKETIQSQRRDGIASKCRNQTVAENMAWWGEMKAGTRVGSVVRAKMSVDDPNKCLRDPVLYRSVVDVPHLRTGDKYKVYPTYDFACPIVDSLDGVSHALRTSEYNDRNPQYHWICDALKLRKPLIEDFSRLNMEFTVMSKRKLTTFVEEKVVDGWNDPRFPTVKGILRRGLTVEALKNFIISQGMSRANNFQEWGQLWNLNRKVIDADENSQCPRYVVVPQEGHVKVALAESPELKKQMKPRHKKNAALGEVSTMVGGPSVLLEEEDLALVKDDEEVTLMSWGNVKFTKVDRDGFRITGAAATVNPNGDFRKTQKLTWIADCPENKVPVTLLEFEHLITVVKTDPDTNFDDIVNKDSKGVTQAWGEAACAEIKKGDVVQFERRGYYICDSVSPLVMINIPDGKSKVNHLSYWARKDRLAGKKVAAKETAKEAGKKDERGMTLEEKRAKKKQGKAKGAGEESPKGQATK